MLARFAEKRGISYTLLSDIGSKVIERLGLLNQHLAEQSAYYGVQPRDHHVGTPYPGTFVLDGNGIIVDKQFEQSYRVRPTSTALLEELGGSSNLNFPTAHVAGDGVEIIARLNSATYYPYQKLLLGVDVRLAPELHVYGRPISDDYTPVDVTVEPLEGLDVATLDLPAPRLKAVGGLDELFPIYEGSLHATLPLLLTKNHGETNLAVNIRYQACSDTLCFPPKEVTLTLTLAGEDNVRD